MAARRRKKLNLSAQLSRAPIGACTVSFAFDFLRLFAAI
jgi:hypothetical protein